MPFLRQVKNLFKQQRDYPSRVAELVSDGGGTDDEEKLGNAASSSAAATGGSERNFDARSIAVASTLKSALRMTCDVTAKI